MASPAFGSGQWPAKDLPATMLSIARSFTAAEWRCHVMRSLSKMLARQGISREISGPEHFGDEGGRVLGAAIAALPKRRHNIRSVRLRNGALTAMGLEPIAAALCKLGVAADLDLDLGMNSGLGDAGAALLAKVAKHCHVRCLNLDGTGCGDAGIQAMAGAFQGGLVLLSMAGCPQIAEAGWAALGARLPSLTSLGKLQLNRCTGLCPAGVTALMQGLAEAPAVHTLELDHCELGDAGAVAMAGAARRWPRSGSALEYISLRRNAIGDAAVAELRDGLQGWARELTIGSQVQGAYPELIT